MHPNPARWKKEQITGCIILVILAAIVGAAVGNYIGFSIASQFKDVAFQDAMMERLTVVWALLFGAIAAVFIYAVQLLRSDKP